MPSITEETVSGHQHQEKREAMTRLRCSNVTNPAPLVVDLPILVPTCKDWTQVLP